MNRLPLAMKTLRDYRLATVAIGVVIFLIALMDLLIYPSYKKSLADMDLPAGFEGFIGEAGSIATPEGFLSAEFFSWMPLLLVVLAIIAGTGAIAGEESAGTMDQLLAQPISRRRLLLERFLGVSLAVTIAGAFALPGFAIGKIFVDFDLSAWRMVQATINMLPVTLFFLALALWGSAALPGRGAATIVSVGVVVVGYFFFTLGAAVSSMDWMQKVSPFYWSEGSHVLIQGFDWARAGLLLGLTAVLLVLAVWSFERRDIATTGRAFRPWARLHGKREPAVEQAGPAGPPRVAGSH